MEWGVFGRWPMEFGGGEPRARQIYGALQADHGVGSRYSTSDDAAVNVELRAAAWAIEASEAELTRAVAQGFPSLSTDYLAAWELLHGIYPDPDASIGQRQLALSFTMGRPPTVDNIVALFASNGIAATVTFSDLYTVVVAVPSIAFANATALKTRLEEWLPVNITTIIIVDPGAPKFILAPHPSATTIGSAVLA